MSERRNLQPATEPDFLPAKDVARVGLRVHVRGWGRGCVFVVVSVNCDDALIETPKTKRKYFVKVNDLLLVRGTR